MKENTTLRQLILQTLSRGEFSAMIDYLFARDSDTMCKSPADPLTREKTENAYNSVIEELLELPDSLPNKFPLIVSMVKDDLMLKPGEIAEEYIDVSMINLEYIEPPVGAKPWGGEVGEVVPEGYYNCNEEKYNKYFGFGLSPWSEIIDNPIFNETNLDDYEILAEILWELTFYGWTQKQQENFRSELDDRLEESKKEIQEGKCTKLPKQEGDKYTVVIPDCVAKSFSRKINNLAEGAD